jgi:hypothetical protein
MSPLIDSKGSDDGACLVAIVLEKRNYMDAAGVRFAPVFSNMNKLYS